MFLALILIMNYYYLRRGEAVKLADTITNMIVMKKCDSISAVRESDVEKMLFYIDGLRKSYGFPEFIIYMQNENNFINGRSLILCSAIRKLDIEDVKIVKTFGISREAIDSREENEVFDGILLNDNRLYYIDRNKDGAGNSYTKIMRCRIKNGLKSQYFSMPPVYNDGLGEPEISFYNTGGIEEKVYFYPKINTVTVKNGFDDIQIVVS